MQNRKLLILCLLFVALVGSTTAQTTNSPYSRYAYGQLANPSFGGSSGMGSASIGMRRNDQINPSNPASYSVIDSTTFLFDFGVWSQNGTLTEGVNKETQPNGNIDHLAIQFPITKGVGASVGLVPYSFVGYQFGNTISKDNLTGTTTYSGEGGLSQAYFGLAASPFKNLSIGANFNYLFGTISNSSTITNNNGASTVSKINQFHGRAFKTDFGMQWNKSYGKDKNICFGLTYTPKTSLSSTSDSITIIGDSTQIIANNKKFELAETFGAGIGWQLDKRWTLALDGLYQRWGNAVYASKTDSLKNRLKIAAGVEFTPNTFGRHYYEHVRYRCGGYVSNNYSNAKNQNINEYGVSFGLGLPFKSTKSMLNISVDYSKVVPEHSMYIKEEYLKFTLNLTFNEFWFFKRKID